LKTILYPGASIQEASKAFILLHGRGGTAQNMLGLVDALGLSNCYVAIPQADNNTWYPHSFMSEKKLNEPYLSQSIQEIHELLEHTSQQIPKDQLFIVGFSQGACLALEVTARNAAHYGGIVAFTGGLIGSTLDESKYHGDFEGTKIFISNGDQDPHIPLIRSQQSQKIMESLGAHVTLKIYPGRPHTITEDEMELVKRNIF
jgi:phospholipase/carboxylesterase